MLEIRKCINGWRVIRKLYREKPVLKADKWELRVSPFGLIYTWVPIPPEFRNIHSARNAWVIDILREIDDLLLKEGLSDWYFPEWDTLESGVKIILRPRWFDWKRLISEMVLITVLIISTVYIFRYWEPMVLFFKKIF